MREGVRGGTVVVAAGAMREGRQDDDGVSPSPIGKNRPDST